MAYDPSLSDSVSQMRHDVGDIDEDNELRPDETYTAALTIYLDQRLAVASIASGLAAQYGQTPDSFGDDGTTISWRDRVKTWLSIADTNRATVAREAAAAAVSLGVTTRRILREPASGYSEYCFDPFSPRR